MLWLIYLFRTCIFYQGKTGNSKRYSPGLLLPILSRTSLAFSAFFNSRAYSVASFRPKSLHRRMRNFKPVTTKHYLSTNDYLVVYLRVLQHLRIHHRNNQSPPLDVTKDTSVKSLCLRPNAYVQTFYM